MKNRGPKVAENSDGTDKFKSINMAKKKKKKNMMRLGGGGLSLDVFANAKSKNNGYNPALIKKQREFYKNAKQVRKFKNSLKQQSEQTDSSRAKRPLEDENEGEDDKKMKRHQNRKKRGNFSMEELYEKKHEEKEKARMEWEASIQARKEAIEKAEARRKAIREKMFKKTRMGQPIMKYKIEHLLESIQGSTHH
ncbi:rRNA-processing protein like [Quillaja saponaria]|uniref:rRNA-processing protein like n=1 Tax=Quillaja saponaria TaxID=32244 RepID=A0AAD7Q122_QUISA|nr:rRNA-processing protein like [Quillaja saponaria]